MTAILPTTYPKCETCKHWTQDGTYLEGDCLGLYASSSIVGTLRAVLSPAQPDSPARVMTLPSFGCLLHSDLAEAGA